MRVTEIIEEIEKLLDESFNIYLLGKIVVDEKKLCGLIMELKENLPYEIKESEKVLKNAKTVIENAQKEAIRIQQEAEEYLNKMAKESEIVKRAEILKNEILLSAHDSAKAVKEGADEYAKSVLNQLEEKINEIMNSIRMGKMVLEERISSYKRVDENDVIIPKIKGE